MLKFEVGSGYYLVNDWADVFSVRVCLPEEKESELYLLFNYKCMRLRDKGELSRLMWIDDNVDRVDGLICRTRRWAKVDSTIFIPNRL